MSVFVLLKVNDFCRLEYLDNVALVCETREVEYLFEDMSFICYLFQVLTQMKPKIFEDE